MEWNEVKKVMDEASKEGADEAQVVRKKPSWFLTAYLGILIIFCTCMCVCVLLCVANICLVNCRFVCERRLCQKQTQVLFAHTLSTKGSIGTANSSPVNLVAPQTWPGLGMVRRESPPRHTGFALALVKTSDRRFNFLHFLFQLSQVF